MVGFRQEKETSRTKRSLRAQFTFDDAQYSENESAHEFPGFEFIETMGTLSPFHASFMISSRMWIHGHTGLGTTSSLSS
jgi:hypothetical protein